MYLIEKVPMAYLVTYRMLFYVKRAKKKKHSSTANFFWKYANYFILLLLVSDIYRKEK